MKTHLIINYVSLIVWIIVPIIYRRHNIFYYFLFLGVLDIIAKILWTVFSISAPVVWFPFHYLMLVGFNRDRFYKNIKLYIIGLIPVLIINFTVSPPSIRFLVFLIHIIFFLFFVKLFTSQFLSSRKIDVFYTILIFYETSSNITGH